jgi:hypothetical protein
MADLQGTGIIDTGFLRIPQGLTANRPGSPVIGLRYFNTSLNIVEWYNGTAWIPEILNVNNDPRVEIFNGGTSETIWRCPPNIYTVQALIVAGGGAGGSANSNCSPAGGGAGGMIDTFIDVIPGNTYTLNVGVGGTGNPASPSSWGNNGANSNFGTYIAIGGGGGGGGNSPGATWIGQPGGSGGGSQFLFNGPGRPGTQPTSASGGYGFPGGDGSPTAPQWGGGGGGGAGSRGGDGTANIGGMGGAGRRSWITGEARWYAGGGGGGHCSNPYGSFFHGRGGIGGGGDGSSINSGPGGPGSIGQAGAANRSESTRLNSSHAT